MLPRQPLRFLLADDPGAGKTFMAGLFEPCDLLPCAGAPYKVSEVTNGRLGSDAFHARTDLTPYGENALLLFALQTALGIEDIHTVAANALTDGPDDKKCDLLFVDRDLGRVIIAQCYMAANDRKKEAPANKASDLNTAAAWFFGGDGTTLPDHLKAAWAELDSALVME